jgi:hypothetical protein
VMIAWGDATVRRPSVARLIRSEGGAGELQRQGAAVTGGVTEGHCTRMVKETTEMLEALLVHAGAMSPAGPLKMESHTKGLQLLDQAAWGIGGPKGSPQRSCGVI